MLLLLIFAALALGAFDCSQISDYPKIQLGWGTYQANYCDEDGEFFTFSNVRYAASPTGHGRFNIPNYPQNVTDPTILLDSGGASITCHQVDTDLQPCPAADSSDFEPEKLSKSKKSKAPQRPYDPFLGGVVGSDNETEDCLFLDIYVPFSATSDNPDTPVIVWFFGGAFEFGTKIQTNNTLGLPLYNGTGIMRIAHGLGSDAIFVTGNYRVGAFGWIAGPSMEAAAKAGDAVPNAGLYDQRLILKFVQDFIGQVGGNKADVSAWGESAGGGSILHHLVAKWPTSWDADPTNLYFQRAIVQSPAFEWQWDRSSDGYIETAFKNLTIFSGCNENSNPLQCMQNLNETDMVNANQLMFNTTRCTGTFNVGPAVDGSLITTLPAITFDNLLPAGLTSFIASHVTYEQKSFIPAYAGPDTGFDTFLNSFLPGDKYQLARTNVTNQYSNIADQAERIGNVLRDSSITCNTRQLYYAYGSDVDKYLMEYAYLNFEKAIPHIDFPSLDLAVHASDILPTFSDGTLDIEEILKKLAEIEFGYTLSDDEVAVPAHLFELFASMYQTYLVSHAITGDPNALKHWYMIDWPQATPGSTFGNVMSPHSIGWFGIVDDEINTQENCEFWQQIMAPALVALGKPDFDAEPNARDEL